ncbi:MAG: type II toxin-antitoxin system HicA family toxin [Nostoc sp.]|uniref:type II toxin-antitoxin system HicA family toxin n=1 Tax=Nostoc sp. TaxID=1180 RepID=UPI002FFC38C6
MSKVPNLPYTEIIAALQRDGWIVVPQRGSHIRLEKLTPDEVLKLTVPAHRPVNIISAKLPIIKEPHPAKAVLCLPSPLAGRGWGWGSSGLISNQADII